MYAFINIFSLAIGLASCIAIYLFITDERSFDAFHTRKDNIYRLDEIQSFPGTNVQNVALSMPGMGPALLKDFPELKNFTRFMNRPKILVEKGDKRFLLPYVALVDSTFLEIFDFEVLMGDRLTALDMPHSVMLTRETALKYFKSLDEALGNTVTLYNEEYKVTGILANVPENSHMQFDALASLTTRTSEEKDFNDRWGSNFLNTYLLLQPGVDIKALEEKFPDFLREHMSDPDITNYYVMFLQRLDQVHLASTDIEHDYNNYRKFNGTYLDIFGVVAVFILLIAGVNFMNLTTARASHRWKEIGVRKTIGAKKGQLFLQFIFESVMLACMALILALIVDAICIPLINELIGRKLSFLSILDRPENVGFLLLLTFGLGVLTGIYPSFYMTSFNMSRLLKGVGQSGTSIFRSGLVVVQFGLAIAMIVSTFIVVQQLMFIQNKDIGFDKDQMMLINMNDDVNKKFETLRTELKRSPYVLGVTASGQRLGENFHQWGFKVKSDTGIFHVTPSNVNVDYEYLTVYGMEIKEGRNFSKDIQTDNGGAFIINESFAKELGLKETIGTPVGHGFYNDDSLGTIIGIVKDFNFNSLHYEINTLAMVVHSDWGYDEMTVKVDGAHIQDAIQHVKETWDRIVADYPLTYSFLDEHFEALYASEQQMSAVVTIMAGLAILISCMGLFGLAAITTGRKVKEIGIRKVLGATETQLTLLLSRNFSLLIVIAFALSSPLTYWLLTGWLESFAYRITIDAVPFILGGVVAMIIALATICYHTLRSARANPVKALRYE